jgi:hypothetical protein
MELGAVSQPLIPTDKRSGLLTHIAATVSFVVRADEKLTAFLELERANHEVAIRSKIG